MEADALERRLVELETRLAFQEHAMNEMSTALADARLESARLADRLRQALDDLKMAGNGDLVADAANEPPPPHY
jgi:SlyX protein